MPDTARTPLDSPVNSPQRPLSVRFGLALVGMCLLPRLLRCCLADAVCPDAFFYFDRAAAIEQGNFAAAFSGGMNLNLYPIVLAALHQCGLDWIDAGRIWNLVVMSLTVLPLYGWVRRIVDDRAALLGCIIYAVWPVMVEHASEPIRDPTYWLLLNLVFYLGITTTARPTILRGLVLAVVWAAAVLTRMEGWLLLLPLSWWLLTSVVESAEKRRKLIRTGWACLAGIVVLTVGVNFTIGRQANTWITGRIETALPGVPWLHNLLHGVSTTRPDGRVVANVEPTTLYSFASNSAETLDPLNLAALVLGLYVGRHLFASSLLRPLLAWAGVMLVAIWCRVPDQRYFSQVGFVLIPFIAVGGAAFIEFVGERLSAWRQRDLRHQWTIAWLSLFAIVSTGDAVLTWKPEFENNYRLAAWFRQEFPAGAIVVSDRASVSARFFMSGPQPGQPHVTRSRLEKILDGTAPQVVVYSCAETATGDQSLMAETLQQCGFRKIEPTEIGIEENTFAVWTASGPDQTLSHSQTASSSDGRPQ